MQSNPTFCGRQRKKSMSTSESNALIIQITKNWIAQFIIELNICPFAGPSFKNDRIDYDVIQAFSSFQVFEEFLKKVTYLLDHPEVSNAFIILPKLDDFMTYLDIFHGCEELLEDAQADKQFQLASFHPNYQFEGFEPEDERNFRNKSPHPMIHILRADEVEAAIESYGDTMEIPKINEQKMLNIGKDKILDLINHKIKFKK